MSTTTAEKLKAQGDKLTKQIQKKMNPACAQQNHTPRRARQVASSQEDGIRLGKIQQALYNLAECHKTRSVPMLLRKVTKKTEIENALFHSRDWSDEWYDQLFDLDIHTDRLYAGMQLEVASLVDDTEYQEMRRKTELRNKEQELIKQVPGYFPTPLPIGKRAITMMGGLELADDVYDPTAGGGALLDAAKEYDPTIKTIGVEQNHTLAELCREKGHNVLTSDTFAHNSRKYMQILANPPFENDGDSRHGLYYFKYLLAPGGRMVLITSSGAFNHTTQIAQEFQALVRAHGYYEELPKNSFAASKTNVNTCIVFLEKKEDE